MKHFHDRATMALIPSLAIDPALRNLLIIRVAELGDDLIDWTAYLVVEPGDAEEDIIRCIGFSPLNDPIDGHRWPDPAFEPGWDWLTDHGFAWELIFTFGSTWATVLFIGNVDGLPTDLRAMCCHYATQSKLGRIFGTEI